MVVLVVVAVVATWRDASAAIKSEITHSYAAVKLGRICHRHPSIGNSLEPALPFLLSLSLSLSLALAMRCVCLICGMSSPLAAAENNGQGQMQVEPQPELVLLLVELELELDCAPSRN